VGPPTARVRPSICSAGAASQFFSAWDSKVSGLATNLPEPGIADKVIQAILRHEDVKTTQRSYINTVPSVVTFAMKRLEEKVACSPDVQQVSVH